MHISMSDHLACEHATSSLRSYNDLYAKHSHEYDGKRECFMEQIRDLVIIGLSTVALSAPDREAILKPVCRRGNV